MEHPPVPRALAKPADLAEFLQVEESTLANWRYRQTGPPWTKIGGQIRYRWESIDAWVGAQSPPE